MQKTTKGKKRLGAALSALVVGGFLVLGTLIAAMQWALSKSKNKEESK